MTTISLGWTVLYVILMLIAAGWFGAIAYLILDL